MPYSWIKAETGGPTREMHLWPHQSLPPAGFVGFVGVTFLLLLIPLVPLLGTVVLWGLLPFMMLALWGLWLALKRSQRNARILEVLTISQDMAHLVRTNPKGDIQEWHANRYWVEPRMHEIGGPVPNYVTLKGEGREVEIGAFLSEDERKALFDDLTRAFRR